MHNWQGPKGPLFPQFVYAHSNQNSRSGPPGRHVTALHGYVLGVVGEKPREGLLHVHYTYTRFTLHVPMMSRVT